MTTRHRFEGFALSMGCKEKFGGAAQCGRPYEHGLHYSDGQHPFRAVEGYPDCGWRRQEEPLVGVACGAMADAEMHDLSLVSSPPSPVQKRPPDEDYFGVPSVGSGVVTFSPPVEPVLRAWEKAVRSFSGLDVAPVTSGPWPARKYWLGDMAEAGTGAEELMWMCFGALVTTGDCWTATGIVSEEKGEMGRWVTVTWGRFFGLSGEDVADEITLEFDDR